MKQELEDQDGNVFFSIEYLESNHILYASWFGYYLPVELVQQGALLVLDKIQEFKVSLLLNDNSKLVYPWDDANAWIEEVWIPKAISFGLKKFAHIISHDLFTKVSAEFMEDNSKKVESNVFQIQLFESQEIALYWLLEK